MGLVTLAAWQLAERDDEQGIKCKSGRHDYEFMSTESQCICSLEI